MLEDQEPIEIDVTIQGLNVISTPTPPVLVEEVVALSILSRSKRARDCPTSGEN